MEIFYRSSHVKNGSGSAAGRSSGIKIIQKKIIVVPIISGISTMCHISLYNFDGLTTAENMLLNRGIKHPSPKHGPS